VLQRKVRRDMTRVLSAPDDKFAAWLGLVPRQNSSGGKERLGGISKRGDRYLRHLLVVGGAAVEDHVTA
jgi:transposase